MCSREFKCHVMHMRVKVIPCSNCSWITDNGCESICFQVLGAKLLYLFVTTFKKDIMNMNKKCPAWQMVALANCYRIATWDAVDDVHQWQLIVYQLCISVSVECVSVVYRWQLMLKPGAGPVFIFWLVHTVYCVPSALWTLCTLCTVWVLCTVHCALCTLCTVRTV